MTRPLLSLIFLFSCILAFAQPRLWDITALEEMRNNPSLDNYTQIVVQADKIAGASPVAVTDKAQSRSGDKHNFESLSIYYWPDPANPSGPYIVKDGQRNPEYTNFDLPRLSKLNYNTSNLAKAYYLTRDKKYYDAFIQQIDTWFVNKTTRMTPNFEYAQFIPGRNEGKGCSAGIIDAYNFIDVIECVRLVDEIHPIGKKRTKKIKKWFADFALWMRESEIGQGAKSFNHNIGTAYDILLFYLSEYENDKKIADHIANEFDTKRISPQIEVDGTQPIQLKRTKVFSYSVSNLRHIMDMCILQKRVPTRVEKALLHLSQYIGKRDKFPHQEIGDWDQAERILISIIRRANQLGCNIQY